ncbi:esterase family protein [Seonamhaeicola sediminis]|uniref:Esterase family protein n=1 Tax=Seonamhaeicola sediminis TaxID=2528206 RepID=A0A562YHZ4_9FLAO|nr:alpha/beta hydrolase-fold protein [Seonamhaeicola sediminis]TWO34663.1 esterase family protein [Seonamhaeicola sediminis]
MSTKFRTIFISDPAFEQGNLRLITVKSENLKGRNDISVYVPEDRSLKDLPVVMLLHGVYGSHSAWLYNAGIHQKMDSWIKNGEIKPMVLVMPSDGLWGDGSGYLPHSGFDFEKWIVEDVIAATHEMIPQVSTKSDIFISGLSMGGFGALRLGAKYGSVFKAFSGLSSITHLDQMKMFIEEDVTLMKQESVIEHSVLETLRANKGNYGPFRFDCGLDDTLLPANRELHQQLQENNIPHLYEEFPGGHEWSYWAKHVFRSINFFNNQ